MQRVLYNGHKKIHSIKFQSVAAPNGSIANLYGPVEGGRNDSGMLADSQLLRRQRQNTVDTIGRPLSIYRDPAYPLRVRLQCPFQNAILTQQQKDFQQIYVSS